MIPRPVVLKNRGYALTASFFAAEAALPSAAMLFCHGLASNRMEKDYFFVRLARRLAAQGVSVLSFDFPGCGESEGEFREITVAGQVAAALDALNHLRRMPEVDETTVGILGYSLGGLSAACLLGREKDLRCGVLWAPVADLPALLKAEMAERGPAEPAVRTLRVGPAFFAGAAAVDPLKEIAAAKAPVLVIHGSMDETVPLENGRRLAEAAPNSKVIILEDAGHGFEAPALGDLLLDESTRWILQHLKG